MLKRWFNDLQGCKMVKIKKNKKNMKANQSKTEDPTPQSH